MAVSRVEGGVLRVKMMHLKLLILIIIKLKKKGRKIKSDYESLLIIIAMLFHPFLESDAVDLVVSVFACPVYGDRYAYAIPL